MDKLAANLASGLFCRFNGQQASLLRNVSGIRYEFSICLILNTLNSITKRYLTKRSTRDSKSGTRIGKWEWNSTRVLFRHFDVFRHRSVVSRFPHHYLSLLASRSDSSSVRMSPSRTGPFTLRMMERFCSPMNSTFTCGSRAGQFSHQTPVACYIFIAVSSDKP